METLERKNKTVGGKHEYVENGVIDLKQLRGRWKLYYEITNTLGPHGFGSVTLDPYIHPKTRLWQYPVVDNSPKVIVEITAAETVYDPDTNPNHRSLVNWMLNHPRVMTDGVDLDKEVLQTKEANSKFRLVNVDLQDFSEFEENNIIDQMVGRLTLTSGDMEITTKKLKYILAKLNMPFKDRRIVSNPKSERLILQNKLKSFVKKGVKEANAVKEIIENLEDARKHYYVKAMIDAGEIKVKNGMLRFKNYSLGVNIDSAVLYFENNTKEWSELQAAVHKL